ncbi:hypothetical protein A1QO_03985 [Vibrio genomosp. F10 str. ZF-129]|uniref:5'-deoxynucleotidase n=1 Tax=Vibrio genomosp. F10 str. ZF-129 TaxID=1187848 RepID=A0A1E5BIL4_9VIBR|nr:5'-deoxynucleotidase [Vibrio genomosp. F10]OEE37271.1 hypothetical protein A1QO_03985 [Vibrio genomosp. F10 str. ZF-129]
MFNHIPNSALAWNLRAQTITRWPLMRSMVEENVAEHCYATAQIAFQLAVIAKVKFNKSVNPERVATLAVFHEVSESAGVSDVPSPVKYANPEVTKAIKELERQVEESLLASEEDNEIREYLKPFYLQSYANDYEKCLCKTADNIAAFLKAHDELSMSNHEFTKAINNLQKKLDQSAKEPEIQYFMEKYLPQCKLTLDELTQEEQER